MTMIMLLMTTTRVYGSAVLELSRKKKRLMEREAEKRESLMESVFDFVDRKCGTCRETD